MKGLLSVAPDGKIKVLTKEAGGIPIGLANDLDIAVNGTIYFSDSSMKYSSVMKDLMEHRPYGRLLAYCPRTKKTRMLLDKLYFANGVALSVDESFVLVSEMWKYRVRRYWLEGPMKGKSDIFIENLHRSAARLNMMGCYILEVSVKMQLVVSQLLNYCRIHH